MKKEIIFGACLKLCCQIKEHFAFLTESFFYILRFKEGLSVKIAWCPLLILYSSHTVTNWCADGGIIMTNTVVAVSAQCKLFPADLITQ